MRILVCLLFIVLFPVLHAADTLDIEDRLLHSYLLSANFRGRVWQNPAINHYRYDYSISQAGAGAYYNRQGEAAVAQLGNGGQGIEIGARSYLALKDNSRVFGEVAYHNGHKENVRWNENDDYALLYPYVTGDSIGGYLNGEEYSFMGGYTHALGVWTAAARLDYRASITYRDKDPRPKNIGSDLHASIALARNVSCRYTFGIALNGRKYNQNSQISFLSDKGSSSVYHLLGMGVDYVRFAGSQYASLYTGTGVGGSLDLIPCGGNGLSASLATSYFHFTKELPNSNYAPVTGLDKTDIRFNVAWQQQYGKWLYGVKLDAATEQRNGTENIFGDPTGGVYPVISSSSQYSNRTTTVELTAIVAQDPERQRMWGLSLLPRLSYFSTNPEYRGAARSVDISSVEVGMEAQSVWRFPGFLLTAGASVGYTTNLTDKRVLTGLNTDLSVAKALLSNINYLSDTYTSAGLSLRGDYQVSEKQALYISIGWIHSQYNVCGASDKGEVMVGITF